MSRLKFFVLGFWIALPLSVLGQNLLTNGDFEAGAAGWWSGVGGGGAATFTIPYTGSVHGGTNSFRANVTATGANPWDVQTIGPAFTAAVGIPHQLTFWARSATGGNSIRVIVQKDAAPAYYGAQDFVVTNTWQQYTFNFTPTQAAVTLRMHYIGTGDFYFDDFAIPDVSGGPATADVVLDPTTTHQEMVGFGGALTWSAERVYVSPDKATLYDLMFDDLGLDIIRLKNWYFPEGYPGVTSPVTMDSRTDWPFNYARMHNQANPEFYAEAKAHNPDIEVLLCSWSPPPYLKSNNAFNTGGLRQNAGQFMYSEFAQYWVDMLNNMTFVPDYISVQNEAGYENVGWETCGWRPTETGGYASYATALDSIWNRIKDRPALPKIVGVEPENIGGAPWGGNTFRTLAETVQPKSYVDVYGYHLYNYGGSNTGFETDPSNLQMVRDDFGDRPAWMTEFSSDNYNWLDIARMIHANVTEANAAAYIYWDLVWYDGDAKAMIPMTAAGAYTIQPPYYAIKHYSKFVDKGYDRIDVSGSSATLKVNAYLNPAGNSITLVAINNYNGDQDLDISLGTGTVLGTVAYESEEGEFWEDLGAVDVSSTQTLPAKSITTYVISLSPLPVELARFNATAVGSNAQLTWTTASETDNARFEVLHSRDGTTFADIGSVAGSGTTSEPLSYTFLDSDLKEGTHYYRLRQVDFSGEATLSPIVSLNVGASSKAQVIAYPNPFTDQITLSGNGDWSGAKVTLTDVMGRTVKVASVEGLPFTLSTSDVPEGIYLIRLQSATQAVVLRAVR